MKKLRTKPAILYKKVTLPDERSCLNEVVLFNILKIFPNGFKIKKLSLFGDNFYKFFIYT
jgi:hypothetical protein